MFIDLEANALVGVYDYVNSQIFTSLEVAVCFSYVDEGFPF
jgi:hypothetical protein